MCTFWCKCSFKHYMICLYTVCTFMKHQMSVRLSVQTISIWRLLVHVHVLRSDISPRRTHQKLIHNFQPPHQASESCHNKNINRWNWRRNENEKIRQKTWNLLLLYSRISLLKLYKRQNLKWEKPKLKSAAVESED